MRKRAALVGVIVAILVVGVLVARRHAVIAALIPRIVGAATGYDVAIGTERLGLTHGALINVRVSRGGDPVLSATRIDIWYNVRDLLPGSSHRYGVNQITIDAPTLTLVRHQDGSYNVSLPHAAPSGPQPPEPLNHVPIALAIRIRDGSGALRAPYALDPQARNLSVRNLTLDADINSLHRTHYTLAGAFVEHVLQPFSGVGTIDMNRGYAMHRVRAAAVPMRAIANFFINSKAAQILGGTATNLDLRAYALGIEPGSEVSYSLGGTLDIADGQMHIVGITEPLRRIAGRLQLVNDAFFARDLEATLANVPVAVSGGLINFSDVHYQLAITTRGDLSDLRNAFAFAQAQPVSGLANATVTIQGPLGSPQINATLDAPDVIYRTIPMHAVHAAIAYANSIVTIAPLRATISGARATVRGMITIGDTVHSQLAVHLDATADELPYIGEVLGSEPLVADALLDGIGTDFQGYAALTGPQSTNRVAVGVTLHRGGVLDVAPFALHTQRGSVDGAYHLNRTTDASAFWVVARNVDLQTPKRGAFGEMLPALPPLDGLLDNLAAQGGGTSGVHAVVAGELRASHTTIANVALAHLGARFAGTLGDAAMSPVSADGPWGSLAGTGALSLRSLAVRGEYRGTLQGLKPFLGGTPASGDVEGTVSLAVAPGRITIQGENLKLQNAEVRGMPLQSASGTLAVENGNLHVFSARATLAGGDVVAAGAYASGIALVATHLNGSHVRGLGLPIDAGVVAAAGRVAAGAPLPQFDGGFSVANGRAQRYAVAGSGLVHLRGNAVHLDHVVGSVDGVYAYANGDITQLSSGAPKYALHAQVPAGDVTRALHTLELPTLYSDGTFNADLAITGSGVKPRVRGPLGVPAGSVNGLPFINASAVIGASVAGAVARRGSMDVGTTHFTFSGAKFPRISSVHVNAPSGNLGDFNNFFDTGDTLAGVGSLKFDVISQRHRISSGADINVRGLRYRNLFFGDTRADWSTANSVVKGTLAIGAPTGTLRASGSIALATDRQPLAILRDSRYDLNLNLQKLDLSTWVAALGFSQVPVTGQIAADASIHGRFPALQLAGTAELSNGTLWRLPIESAQLAFASRARGLDLTSASLVANGITATASGTFGLRPTDPLKLSVYLNSDDIPNLVAQLYDVKVPVSGDFESTVTIGGSVAKPSLAAAFDASNASFYGVKVSSIFGSLALVNGSVELRNAGAQFETGDIALAGTLPLRIDPFGIGPDNAPVSLDLAVNGVNPEVFAPLFGSGTTLGGTIDGALGISGTVDSPRIYGKFGVARGSYVSTIERVPIRDITASLQFSRVDASVDALSARFGNGTISGSGHIAFADGTTFAVNALAKGAQLDLPQYGKGTLDGTLSLTRVKGQPALLSGSTTLSSATIPFTAFLNATQGSSAPPLTLPFGLGFNVNLLAGQGVRVRGTGFGAGLDIGGTGSVNLAGTLAAPTLDGHFTSTGGTLTYFDRAFRVQQARVSFDPAQGILPTLHATGTTHVTNGDPDSSRNPYGSADITIKVDGPLNGLTIGFTSNPPGYSNDQILAMIAPFGGLINGVAYTPFAATSTINGLVPFGALSPIPAARAPGAVGTSAAFSVGQEAFNIVNAQFASGLLAPMENALSNGLGIQNVNVSLDYYGNVGVSATRLMGKSVNIIYSTSFGVPVRQSVGLQLLGSRSVSAQLSFYLQNGTPTLYKTPIAIGEPLQGSSGFSFTLQRLYW